MIKINHKFEYMLVLGGKFMQCNQRLETCTKENKKLLCFPCERSYQYFFFFLFLFFMEYENYFQYILSIFLLIDNFHMQWLS